MCISCEMHDKWPPLIEFLIWFILMTLSVANHFGVWVVSKTKVVDITGNLYRNATEKNETMNSTWSTLMPFTLPNETTLAYNLTTLSDTSDVSNAVSDVVSKAVSNALDKTSMVLGTLTTLFDAESTLSPSTLLVNTTNKTIEKVLWMTPEQQWDDLLTMRTILLVFCCIGVSILLLHSAILLPNVVQSCRVDDPLALKESEHWYFQNLLKMHALFLVLETIIFDIPVGCITMEILSIVWNTGVTYTPESPLDEMQAMEASKMILGLSLIGLAFIAMYKGMMPLFLWIGNPFCFPCIPVRLIVVLPGGLIALVMTFGPIMGLAKNRLLQYAPEVMQAEIGEVAKTFFSIGMIFWGVFGMIAVFGGCCWYQFCREGAKNDNECFCC